MSLVPIVKLLSTLPTCSVQPYSGETVHYVESCVFHTFKKCANQVYDRVYSESPYNIDTRLSLTALMAGLAVYFTPSRSMLEFMTVCIGNHFTLNDPCLTLTVLNKKKKRHFISELKPGGN